MAKIQHIQTILEQDMSRREFLTHIVIACAALFGVHKLLDAFSATHKSVKPHTQFGAYGTQTYSGIPTNNFKNGAL